MAGAAGVNQPTSAKRPGSSSSANPTSSTPAATAPATNEHARAATPRAADEQPARSWPASARAQRLWDFVGDQCYRYPLVWLLAALLLGIPLGERLADWQLWLCLGAVPGLLALAVGLHRNSRLGRSCEWAAGGLALISACLFMAWSSGWFRPPAADALWYGATRQSQPIAVRVVFDTSAVWKPNPNHRPEDPLSPRWQTEWDVICEAVRDGRRWRAIDARCSLTAAGRIDDFLPGDVAEVYGTVRRIPHPTNPGAFDFAEFSRHESHFVRLSSEGREQMTWLESRGTHPLRRLRGRVVRAVDKNLYKWVAGDQAPLAAALVFGQRAQVDWDDQQELMATGTLHLLAISGMHVGIIAALIVLVCGLCSASSRVEFAAILTLCGLYAALAGGQPPVLRAVVLVALFGLARVWGRKTRLANFLSLAAMVLLFLQASNLQNVGVHLSFLAVASIGIFAIDRDFNTQRRTALQSVVEQSYGILHRRWLVCLRTTRAAVLLSFWVWLMTCPLIWTHFHVVAPIAIPLNVLIAVPLVISLVCGLLTGLCGWLPPLAWLTGQLTGGGLTLIAWMVAVGKSLPLSHVWLPAPPLWWVVSFYALTLLWLIANGKRRRGWLALILSVWLGGGLALFSLGPRGYGSFPSSLTEPVQPVAEACRVASGQQAARGELRCTFLDVGHGTSVIVELPDGGVWLYDAGHLGADQRSHQAIAEALWDLPTARLELLMISHADADHYNAVPGLVERFRVDRIASTRRFWQATSRHVTEVHEILTAQQVQRLEWDSTSHGSSGEVRWQILHPRESLQSETDNASSLCLLLEYAGKRLLLPGDIEGSGLQQLVRLPERPCHVLMAPHHGSLSHDPGQLLEWCQPEVIVISGNHRAVRPSVLAQYARPASCLGVTFRDGAIQVRITAEGQLTSWHWAGDRWESLAAEENP